MSTTMGSYLIVGRVKEKCLEKLDSLLSNEVERISLDEDDGQSIGVGEIRSLSSDLQLKPRLGIQKIGVIPSAEKLTIEAQNALLKTLEEPPQGVSLYLIATDLSSLLPTIISRCILISVDATLSLSPQDKDAVQKMLPILLQPSLGAKLKLAAEIAPSRSSALDWLDKFLIYAHQERGVSPLAIRQIFEAKRRLKANSNVRLTMENLFINW